MQEGGPNDTRRRVEVVPEPPTIGERVGSVARATRRAVLSKAGAAAAGGLAFGAGLAGAGAVVFSNRQFEKGKKAGLRSTREGNQNHLMDTLTAELRRANGGTSNSYASFYRTPEEPLYIRGWLNSFGEKFPSQKANLGGSMGLGEFYFRNFRFEASKGVMWPQKKHIQNDGGRYEAYTDKDFTAMTSDSTRLISGIEFFPYSDDASENPWTKPGIGASSALVSLNYDVPRKVADRFVFVFFRQAGNNVWVPAEDIWANQTEIQARGASLGNFIFIRWPEYDPKKPNPDQGRMVEGKIMRATDYPAFNKTAVVITDRTGRIVLSNSVARSSWGVPGTPGVYSPVFATDR